LLSNGVLAHCDELARVLLSAWDGKSGYTFDRIIRGKTRIEAACLSLLGTTQPSRIVEYVRMAVRGRAGDDGLLQRFSLLVWPDQSSEWRECDRYKGLRDVGYCGQNAADMDDALRA